MWARSPSDLSLRTLIRQLRSSRLIAFMATSTEVHAIHPSGLPLARDPWMVQGSFGFPPELRTPPLPATHAEGGARPLSTCLRLRTRHQAGLLSASPLATCDLVSQLLLAVDRDRRLAPLLEGTCLLVDVDKLGVTIGVVSTLFRFAGALQAVVQRVQQVRHGLM